MAYDMEAPMEIEMPTRYNDDDKCCNECTKGDWCALTTFIFFLTSFLGGVISWSFTVKQLDYNQLPIASGIGTNAVPKGMKHFGIHYHNNSSYYPWDRRNHAYAMFNLHDYQEQKQNWMESGLRYEVGCTPAYWCCLVAICAASFLTSASSCCAKHWGIRLGVWLGSLLMSLYFITSIVFDIVFQYGAMGFEAGGGEAPTNMYDHGKAGAYYRAFGFIVPAYSKIMYGLDNAWNMTD